MHSRISLHQIPFIDQPTDKFLTHCRSIGLRNVTLISPALLPEYQARPDGKPVLNLNKLNVAAISHAFARQPNLEHNKGEASQELLEAIDFAAAVNAKNLYFVSGGRGSLSWESAASKLSDLLSPCLSAAKTKQINLLVETATGFNVDIHIAHTLDDTIELARLANIGVCIELHACWYEARLKEKFLKAAPITGLVQVSDYVLGDRSAPCRAVPGDGIIPLNQILGDLLDTGYEGLFDIELVGPRIVQEGVHAATQRACEAVSEILEKLGV